MMIFETAAPANDKSQARRDDGRPTSLSTRRTRFAPAQQAGGRRTQPEAKERERASVDQPWDLAHKLHGMSLIGTQESRTSRARSLVLKRCP